MHSQQRIQDQRVNAPAKEEKPVGGVSAKLDYDMDVMTDFVCEMAIGMYALLKSHICLTDIDIARSIQPNQPMPQSFRKWVHQVLCATRLPSATIVLSLFYLSHRMNMRSVQNQSNEFQLYRMLTIALVLGSKFLDDNTFINRSWSEVSGIPVADLNQLETEWLIAIEFKLHRDPAEDQGWNTWQDHWKNYQTRVAARQSRVTKLSPIDTTVQRQRSFNANKPLPPLPMPQNFGQPPAYEYASKSAQAPYNPPSYQQQFDPWNISRSTNDHSPASAPTTGPTTPEYYGVSGTWAPAEGYTRRTMFGIPPLSHGAPTPQHHHLQTGNYGPHAFPQYNPSGWNAHSPNCGCTYCVQRQPYFMAPGFAPQAVAV
jgi:hypothetical protein